MSTVTRRKKAAAAIKATKGAVTLPVFDPGNGNGKDIPNGAKPEEKRTLRMAKPIVANLSTVADYEFTDHALEQMNARNISPAEVLSAIIAPDTIAAHNDKHGEDYRQLDRGDIRIVVNPHDRAVITAIDLDEDIRALARVPQTANLIVPKEMPNILPPQEKRMPTRVPKDLPESEEIRWLFAAHRKEDIRYIDVSPVIAQALLDRNTRNRPKRASDVEDWANEMNNGRWRITHQGVAIARDGVILDGQHRLEGIVFSGVTCRMPIAVGLDPEVFTVIDTGRTRKTSDALAMAGEKSVMLYGAVTRLAYMFDVGLLTGGAKKARIHIDTLMAYRSNRDEMLAKATRYASTSTYQGLAAIKSSVGAAYFLLHRDVGNEAMVDEFFDGIQHGVSLARDDVRYKLRRSLSNDMKRNAVRHMALILKAWSLFARGETVGNLVWRIDEEFPTIFLPPPPGYKATPRKRAGAR